MVASNEGSMTRGLRSDGLVFYSAGLRQERAVLSIIPRDERECVRALR